MLCFLYKTFYRNKLSCKEGGYTLARPYRFFLFSIGRDWTNGSINFQAWPSGICRPVSWSCIVCQQLSAREINCKRGFSIIYNLINILPWVTCQIRFPVSVNRKEPLPRAREKTSGIRVQIYLPILILVKKYPAYLYHILLLFLIYMNTKMWWLNILLLMASTDVQSCYLLFFLQMIQILFTLTQT